MTYALSHPPCTNVRQEHHQPLHHSPHTLSLTLIYFYTLTLEESTTQRMASPSLSLWHQKPQTIFFLIICISFPYSLQEEGITSSKKLDLDQPVFPPPADTEIKCGSCPCGSTCVEQLPPPSPPPPLCPSPPPPPPLPSPPPPPPPSPPPPKTPSCPQNCNPLMPPPPPRFIYVPVPGVPKPYTWVYYYSAAENRAVGFLGLVGLGGLSMATLFWMTT